MSLPSATSKMEVDEARRKREREGEFHDIRDEEVDKEEEGEEGKEAEKATKKETPKLELSDIMAMLQKSMDKNDAGFTKLDREMAATKHETMEGKKN